nr:RNA-directed DNA polymerase from mobile element jockey isoform X1 [Nothobranchius furzeri]
MYAPPPSANAEAACDSLHSVVSRLQTQSPRAFFIISGDFNHASLDSTMPTFTQYVTCLTRGNNTLDLLYANAEKAYSSSPFPPLGRSDHNLVYLAPVYESLVRREPPATRTIQRCSEESEEVLKDCFETTVWGVFCKDHGDDIDSLTACITDYINFCVDSIIPIRTVRCFSNNKPWITPEIKEAFKQKKRAFKLRDTEELKRVQRELRRLIRNGKDIYRQRMENQLQQSNVGEVWRGLRTISGHKHQNSLPVRDVRWANELNQFFNRFDSATRQTSTSAADSPTLSTTVSPLTSHPSSPSVTVSSTHFTQGPGWSLSTTQVRGEMRRINGRKAAGPDGISAWVVRSCADQLCEVIGHLFNLSLRLGRVPKLWKTSCVVPVPKTTRPKDFNSYRPVALTSHLMKTLERLVLVRLRCLVGSSLDPLQFAYQSGIGADDAVIHLQHRSLAHLETVESTVKIMFFDFSSDFNTILPSVLKDKLVNAGVDHHFATWILDYLSDRPQYVRAQGCVSDSVVCSTGVPQGTVLAPFLFTIYTADFSYNTTQCFLQMFSDDSAIVGLIRDGDDKEYRRLTQDFVDWCQLNYLQINASKTKELVVDFRRHKHSSLQPLSIQGMDIEIVDSYMYLGVHLNNKLDWNHNSDALYRKGQSRLYLLRRLRSFGVVGPLLKTFYDSVVASAIFYGVVCWGSSISAGDRKRLNRLIRRASSVLGCPLDPVEVVSDRRMTAKLSSMLNNISHPIQVTLTAMNSSFSGRLRHPRCGTERFRRSFLPTAVRLYNRSVG